MSAVSACQREMLSSISFRHMFAVGSPRSAPLPEPRREPAPAPTRGAAAASPPRRAASPALLPPSVPGHPAVAAVLAVSVSVSAERAEQHCEMYAGHRHRALDHRRSSEQSKKRSQRLRTGTSCLARRDASHWESNTDLLLLLLLCLLYPGAYLLLQSLPLLYLHALMEMLRLHTR